jgi:predicted ATPase/DNA-binding XRE family transcriptional regulator
MSFGQRLRGLRRDLGLSQAELADKAGCAVHTVRKLESDERRPSPQLATRLSEVLELPPRDRPEFVRLARRTSVFARPTLPTPVTGLIGREQDIAALKDRLVGPDVRLLSLVGPPGVGKTRLALQAATELQEVFRDGATFVALAAVRDPALVIEAIAQTLGVRGASSRPLEQVLIEHLSSRQLLLVLDNFEQVVAARDHLVTLLVAAPRLKIMVTSRESLDVYGEHVYDVHTLGLPDPTGSRRQSATSRSPAERLFLDRARAVRPNFASAPADQPVVAQICRRTEGLPLAIELAASRARTLSPRALLEQLGQRLDLLSAGPIDFTPRQQSMRGALDWSYDLLDDGERRLFCCASIFSGGATADAIAAVCAEPIASRVAESLADKSLFNVREVAGTTRFEMLETVREYALERLAITLSVDEQQLLRTRHAAYFVALAARAGDKLRGAEQIAWLQCLDADHANLRAAHDWSLDYHHAEIAGRLCADLWLFWRTRGYFQEGRRRLSATLALDGGFAPEVRAALLNGAGALALAQSDYAVATGLLNEARDLYTRIGDLSGEAYVLSNLGIVAHDTDDAQRAQTLFEESLRLRRSCGEDWGVAAALHNLGMIALGRGAIDEARKLFDESAQLFRRVGDWRGLAQALSNLGWATQELGDFDRATTLFKESLELGQRLEDARAVASNLSNLGLMALYHGDYASAGDLYIDSLVAFNALGYGRGVAESLEGLAGVAGVQGRARDAARLFGHAEMIRETLGAPLLPVDRSRYTSTSATAREQLDDAAWNQALTEGRGMSVEDILATLLG